MRPRFLHPSGRVGVGDEVEEPAKQRQAVPAPEPEPGGVRREGIGERAWIVVSGPDGVSHHVRHRFGVLVVVEKVGSDPGWPGDRHAVERDPLALAKNSPVEPDVGAARLPPVREREIVPLRREVAEAIQRRRGAVGYHPLLRRPLPSRNLRGELKPRRAKAEVIRRRRPCFAVRCIA